MTVGAEVVSQNSDGDYMLGSQTLTPGMSVTQGSGSSATIVELETDRSGKTGLVVEDSEGTSTADLSSITFKSRPTQTFMFVPTIVTIHGSTVSIGAGATLNAEGTGSADGSSPTDGPASDNGAAGKLTSCAGVLAALAVAGVAVL